MTMTSLKDRGILIVDDEPVLREMVKTFLVESGYRHVMDASGGTEALSILAADTDTIHLVLLDLAMPGLDGFGVMRHLANVHRHHVGVIVLTGFGTIENVDQFYRLGSEHVMPSKFLQKPTQFAELLEEIESTLLRVHERRLGHLQATASAIHARLDRVETSLQKLELLPQCVDILQNVVRERRGFLAELGFELIKAIVIALAILAILYLGVGDLLRKLIGNIH